MLFNILTLFLHVVTVSSLTLFALRIGREALVAWLALLIVAVNLFVLKQITLFGLSVTCSDALAVGYLLGLNLIQEFFGQKFARKTVWTTFFISISFLCLSLIHLAYHPNGFDTTHSHFLALFTPMPRIIFASLFTFLLVQFFNITLFSWLTSRTSFAGRTLISLLASMVLDTLLFSFLGLYGIAANLLHVILFSLAVKSLAGLLSAPFVLLSKRVIKHETV
ncbi:MAG: hypothetical protein KR126chlam2_00042 [Chlamydiae bacterium]|nr:hypothetical protein [Chlamydiota bacterium]